MLKCYLSKGLNILHGRRIWNEVYIFNDECIVTWVSNMICGRIAWNLDRPCFWFQGSLEFTIWSQPIWWPWDRDKPKNIAWWLHVDVINSNEKETIRWISAALQCIFFLSGVICCGAVVLDLRSHINHATRRIYLHAPMAMRLNQPDINQPNIRSETPGYSILCW